ncbi:hypothetical protein B0T10DRAFT_470934 [Thelonectria olida]|uniref:Uncharacterized protein n=1 Tax=Thelonectria olida TaxID=1576542 RepID=A0A9P8WI86_9HYPO|nr:hypothetical protein B0T10DRAFT_470934 [Thelonectria olida]
MCLNMVVVVCGLLSLTPQQFCTTKASFFVSSFSVEVVMDSGTRRDLGTNLPDKKKQATTDDCQSFSERLGLASGNSEKTVVDEVGVREQS